MELFITFDIQLFNRSQLSEPVNLVRVLLGMLPLCCGALYRNILEIAQILTSFDGMGKNVNALLAIVYEYNRVTTAQENQQSFVLYLFYVFFSTLLMLHFPCFNSTVSVMFPLCFKFI